MTRPRKILSWLAVVLALLAGGLLLAQQLLDGEYLARLAREKAWAGTQRELQVEALRLRLFPVPTLQARRLALANPAWASGPLAQADDFSGRLELRPLLSGQLVLRSVAAKSLQLNLETDAQGRRSWDLPASDQPLLDVKKIESAQVERLLVRRKVHGEDDRQWAVDKLHAQAGSGWRDFRASGELVDDDQRMRFTVSLDDASQLGQAGASSNGRASFAVGQAELKLQGRFPLHAALDNYDLSAALSVPDFAPVQRLLHFQGKVPRAPVSLQGQFTGKQDVHQASGLVLDLGRQNIRGSGRLLLQGKRPRLEAQLESERLDWAQMMADLGFPAPPPKPAGELLPVHAFPWPALAALQKIDARLDTHTGVLVTRGGLPLEQWRGQVLLGEAGIAVQDAQFRLMGGAGSGHVQLDPARRQAQLKLRVERLLLQDWFKRQPSRAGMVSNGPMNLVADLRAHGNSWKEFGATLTGPVSIAIGEMQVRSRKAQEAEAMLVGLVPAVSEKNAEEVKLACLQAALPFANGQAGSEQLVGMRSEASKMLMAGVVDLRSQKLDLRGRVRANKGMTLGIASLTGDVRVAGPIQQPEVKLEPVGALARLGAAIMTTGLSVLATAVYDAATSDEDPCAIVSQAQAAVMRPAAAPKARVKPRDARRKPGTR